jgi:hypothetical protein
MPAAIAFVVTAPRADMSPAARSSSFLLPRGLGDGCRSRRGASPLQTPAAGSPPDQECRPALATSWPLAPRLSHQAAPPGPKRGLDRRRSLRTKTHARGLAHGPPQATDLRGVVIEPPEAPMFSSANCGHDARSRRGLEPPKDRRVHTISRCINLTLYLHVGGLGPGERLRGCSDPGRPGRGARESHARLSGPPSG